MKKEQLPALNRLARFLPRLGTALFLTLLVWGCAAVPTLKEGSEGVYVRLPFVRVLLADRSSEMFISGGTSFAVECIRGDKNFIYHSSRPVTLRQENGLISLWADRSKVGGRFDKIIIVPRGNKGFLAFENERYRGMFEILAHGVNLRLINIVHMDDYLKGVVPPEMGSVGESELEAIKAQAVAARTYSMSHLSQYPDENFDMKSDVSDQIYHGVEVEQPIISEAIDATRGYVIKHGGRLINAYYHSTCGGYTDDIDEVWDKPSAPYLRAVNDSGYCSWSKYYDWRESYSGKQLKLMMEQYLSSERGREIRIDDVTDIYIRSTTAGGRVAELVVETTKGNHSFGKDRIRWVFRRSSNPELILQSARFTIETKHDGNGNLVRADFLGSGYGHGVGMCQCGAIGMARSGKKFDDILTFYYRNVEVVKLY
jgi:stage II sporulation protein D